MAARCSFSRAEGRLRRFRRLESLNGRSLSPPPQKPQLNLDSTFRPFAGEKRVWRGRRGGSCSGQVRGSLPLVKGRPPPAQMGTLQPPPSEKGNTSQEIIRLRGEMPPSWGGGESCLWGSSAFTDAPSSHFSNIENRKLRGLFSVQEKRKQPGTAAPSEVHCGRLAKLPPQSPASPCFQTAEGLPPKGLWTAGPLLTRHSRRFPPWKETAAHSMQEQEAISGGVQKRPLLQSPPPKLNHSRVLHLNEHQRAKHLGGSL